MLTPSALAFVLAHVGAAAEAAAVAGAGRPNCMGSHETIATAARDRTNDDARNRTLQSYLRPTGATGK